jgi:hypothetical protein
VTTSEVAVRESNLFILAEARHTNTMEVKNATVTINTKVVEVLEVVEAVLAEVAEKTQVAAASIGTSSNPDSDNFNNK